MNPRNFEKPDIEERRELEQYFFTKQTARDLASLAVGRTACICTPTVWMNLSEELQKLSVVFDIDPRLTNVIPNGHFVKYDLSRGIHSSSRTAKDIASQFMYGFDTIIMDPPFSTPIEIVAATINAFLSWDLNGNCGAYIVYPKNGIGVLENHLNKHGICGQEYSGITIAYQNPHIDTQNKEEK